MLAGFPTRVKSRNVHFLDVDGHHPHINKVTVSDASLKRVYNYVTKDGMWWGAENPPTRCKTGWEDLIEAQDRQEFMAAIRDEYPRDMVMGWGNVKQFAADHFPTHVTPTARFTFDERNLHADMINWRDVERHAPERPKSLCIISPSRYGKTQWAISTCPRFAYVNGEWDLTQLGKGHEGFILDDVPSKYFLSSLKGLIGAQAIVTLNDKYQRKLTMEWGKPCIILVNNLPEEIAGDAWWMANVVTVSLQMPLF